MGKLNFFYKCMAFQVSFLICSQALAAKSPKEKRENCQVQVSSDKEAELKKLGKSLLRDLGFPEAAEVSDAEVQTYEDFVAKLPRALEFNEVIPAVAVADYDEDAIPFIEKICKKFETENERITYFAWLVKRRITGARVAKFDSVIGGDVKFGLELLKDNDPLLKDVE